MGNKKLIYNVETSYDDGECYLCGRQRPIARFYGYVTPELDEFGGTLFLDSDYLNVRLEICEYCLADVLSELRDDSE